jgi:hypothetical protein
MISFRKHAPRRTRRPNSVPGRRARAAVLLLSLLLLAPVGAAAQQKEQAAGRASAPAEEARVPVRVTRVETPDGPGVVATIGEFPSDLEEAGQEFLKREFFEHFASDVLGLGDSDTSRATLKVAMLPQEKENQREGEFTAGRVSGHMVVLVEKRRVLVACTFAETERGRGLLAAARGGAGGAAGD